jgi:tetratricopeptide (TPR) repeat protein
MALNGSADRSAGALERAILALNSQRPKDAELIAGEVLKADPRHTRALYILGYALLMQGRPQEAIAALELAVRGQRDPEIDTQLGIALRQVGRHDDALSRLKHAAKRRPPFGPAFLELGSLLMTFERYDEAIEAFSRGVEVAPMLVDLPIQLGFTYLRCRNCANAKVAFARALNISPGSHAALFGMAKAHQEVGENRMAAEYFRRCLMSRSNDASAWLSLGHCLLELGDRDAGFECFRTVARSDPKRYGDALASLVKSSRGRFWLKPSAAAQFLSGTKN